MATEFYPELLFLGCNTAVLMFHTDAGCVLRFINAQTGWNTVITCSLLNCSLYFCHSAKAISVNTSSGLMKTNCLVHKPYMDDREWLAG